MKYNLKFSIYQFGVIIMFAMKSLGYDSTDKSYQIAMVGVSTVLLLKYIIQSHYRKKELYYAIGLIMLSILVTLISKQFAILATVIIVITSKNENIDNLLGKILRVHVLCFSMVVIGWLLGIIPDYSTVMSKGMHSVFGYSLGYRHPNIAGLQAMILLLLQLFHKRSFFTYSYSSIIAIVVGLLSESRTSLYLSILIVFSFLFFDILKKFNRLDNFFQKVKSIVFLYPLLMASISWGSVYLFNLGNTIMTFINTISSGRIQLSARYLDMYSIKLFGQTIISYGTVDSYLRLDNGYLNILLRFGLIIFVLFIISQMYCMKKLMEKKKYYECLVILIFLTYGLIETYIYNVFVNFSLLYLGELIYLSQYKLQKIPKE